MSYDREAKKELQGYVRRAMQNVDSVLQYSRSKKDLDIWMWSV
jgi:hypothetical protein